MREVPSLLYAYMSELLEGGGRDTRAALAGLPLAAVRPRIGVRVDWDPLAIFLNRATDGLPDDELESLGEGYVRVNRYLGALLSAVKRPTVFYRILWLASRHAFPHMSFRVEAPRPSELGLTMTLPRSFEGCRFFFRGTIGELRALPRLLRLPDAIVEADVGTHEGHYRVLLSAPERTWSESRGEDFHDLLVEDVLSAIPPLGDVDGAPVSVVYALQQRHGLTRAEARVAVRLADGMALREIARDLHVTIETVRTHLKRAYGKLGVRRQAELVRLVLALGADQDV